MPRALGSRTKFIVRSRRHKKSLPWLRHKFLQWQLWTAAYMLDPWEAVLIMSFPLLALAAGWYYLASGAETAQSIVTVSQ